MKTRYEVLPPIQRRVLPDLAPLQRFGFVLYRGTAIALRLGHRVSIDFDFFTDRTMDREVVTAAIPLLADAATLQDERDSWTVQLLANEGHEASLKLSFFSGLGFGRVGQPSFDDEGNLVMASLDDLLGHKLKVLLQRVEAKDYLDIAAMLDGGQSLARGLGAAIALFPNFPPCEAVKPWSISKVRTSPASRRRPGRPSSRTPIDLGRRRGSRSCRGASTPTADRGSSTRNKAPPSTFAASHAT